LIDARNHVFNRAAQIEFHRVRARVVEHQDLRFGVCIEVRFDGACDIADGPAGQALGAGKGRARVDCCGIHEKRSC
jgi:hypothetical protein